MSSNLSSSFPEFKLRVSKTNGHSIYVFDGFRLDGAKRMLYRGEAEIPLPPKAIETLAVLVEKCGEIISKEELIEAVWKDAFVEDSNLSHYLYLLRKSLGPRRDGKPYIETLRKRGYRFDPENLTLETASNAQEAIPLLAVSNRQFHVERRGNVLALVDWQEVEPAATEARAELETSVPPRPENLGWTRAVVIGSVAICVLAAIWVAFYLSWDRASAEEEAALEQNVLRLTNGIEVGDATISPDGKYFVYHEPDGKLYRMWLQQTGHATRQEIVPASERIPLAKTFTPDGQFIYFHAVDNPGESGSVYRVATLGGPLTKILSGVSSGVSFSPDGRQMVFYRVDENGAKYLIKASDGSGSETVLLNAGRHYGSSAWSHDGRSIAVQQQAEPDEFICSIAIVDRETGKVSPLSDQRWESCGRMEWAPDGRGLYMIATREGEGMTTRRDQVYYISYPQGKSRKITNDGSRHQYASLGVSEAGAVLTVPYNRSSQIWVMDSKGDSRTAVQITTGLNDGRSGIGPLADGRVAYISRTGESLNVWVTNQDGSDQRQITADSNAMEELRSGGDGRYLVYSGYLDRPHPHLFRINPDGTGLRQLTSGDGKEIDSSMSHDGKWVAFDSTRIAGTDVELSLWKQSIEGGERISLNRTDCQMPHFSPDDKYISCVRQQKEILILSATDGTLVRTISVPDSTSRQFTMNFGARWAPDGKAFAIIVSDKGVSNIWIQPIDGSSPKQLTNFTNGSIYHFAYSLDGSRLFLARGNQIRDAILISDSKN